MVKLRQGEVSPAESGGDVREPNSCRSLGWSMPGMSGRLPWVNRRVAEIVKGVGVFENIVSFSSKAIENIKIT
jgi:hypothetical protein